MSSSSSSRSSSFQSSLQKYWITCAAALTGASGVLLGAFGAHGLNQAFPLADAGVWRTAVLYHLLHAVGLLALALYQQATSGVTPHRSLHLVAGAFVLGVLLFSGSLYILTTVGSVWGAVLGPLTPVGGVVLVIGWLLLLRP
jgi:uncharacterized membrane protein YgdD (TMEM256/DUF423 family)